MTRILSELLQAPEPFFRMHLRQLEQVNGHPSADIRLTNDIVQRTKGKLKELGLDATDTTGEELYHVLQSRIVCDDARLTRRLRTLAATHISAEADLMGGMVYALKTIPINRRTFALKATVFKTLLKKNPPKRAMKQLGYRSLASMLKHEQVGALMAAAWMSESAAWQRSFIESYKHLRPSDFESRDIITLHPTGKRWTDISSRIVSETHHNILAFKELGAIVLLPLPEQPAAGATTASFALALEAVNEIRAGGTFLKLSQVRADFGSVVAQVARSEPQLQADLLDQPVAWELIQRYYNRMAHRFHEALFEPHISLDDLHWHSVEKVLSHLEPSFAFWQHTAHLGLVDGHDPVSLNMTDAALNACNDRSFKQRISYHGVQALWHELIMRYLQPQVVEQALLRELQPEFAEEPALI